MKRRRILHVVALLLIPFVAALIVFAFFSMPIFRNSGMRAPWTLWTFVVALVVVVGVLVAELLLAASREREIRRGMPTRTGDTSQQLADKWRELAALLKKSAVGGAGRRTLAALPWYVIIGPSGAGKTTALKCADIDLLGDAVKGEGGTLNCDWWFSNAGIFLDTAGRYLEDDESADEWGKFLALVRRNRSRRPINGVIVSIPATFKIRAKDGSGALLDVPLLSMRFEDLELHGKLLRARLDELIDHLGITFPVWVVLTKADQIGGFTEFFGGFDPVQRAQMLGWTSPPTAGAYDPASFELKFDQLLSQLRKARPLLVRLADENDRAAAFAFPDEFAEVGLRVRVMLERTFGKNIYKESPVFRGFYVTSGKQDVSQTQIPAAAAVHRLFGQSAVKARTPVRRASASYFMSDLMHKRIGADYEMTWTTRSAVVRSRHRRWGINMLGLSVAVLVWFLAIAFYRKASASIGTVEKNVSAVLADRRKKTAVERLEALRCEVENFSGQAAADPSGGTSSLKDALRRLEGAMYTRLVLQKMEDRAQAEIARAPTDKAVTEQVRKAVAALLDFENAAALFRGVHDEVRRRRAKFSADEIPPEWSDSLVADLTGQATPDRGTEKCQTSDIVAEAELVRTALDQQAAAAPGGGLSLLKSAKSMPALREIIPEVDATQCPEGRLALAVFRNHDNSELRASWGKRLVDGKGGVRAVLANWRENQQTKFDLLEKWRREGGDKFESALKGLESAVTQAPIGNDSAKSLRRQIESVRGECKKLAAGGDPAAGGDVPAGPDHVGWEKAEDDQRGLVELLQDFVKNKHHADVAKAIDAQACLDAAAKWWSGGPANAASVGAEHAAVAEIGDAIDAWLKSVDGSKLADPDRLREAATSLRLDAETQGADFQRRLAKPFEALALGARLPAFRALAQRYAYARDVENLLAGAYDRLAQNVDFTKESHPVGGAAFGTAMGALLLMPGDQKFADADDALAGLTDDLRVEIRSRADRRVERLVGEAKADWSKEILDKVKLRSAGLSPEAFAKQFRPGGAAFDVATRFEAAFLPLQGILRDKATAWSRSFLVLQTSKLSTLSEQLDAPLGALSRDEDFAERVRQVREKFSQPLSVPDSADEEKSLRVDLEALIADRRLQMCAPIQDFVNAQWSQSHRATVQDAMSGQALTKEDRQRLQNFVNSLRTTFGDSGVFCGLYLDVRVRQAVEKALGSVWNANTPIKVTITRVSHNFDPVPPAYLLVRYWEDGWTKPMDRAWNTGRNPTEVFDFIWRPGVAKKFELASCYGPGQEERDRAQTLLSGTGAACVRDVVEVAESSGAETFTWHVDKQTITLQVHYDRPDLVLAIGAPTARLPERCVERR